MNQTLPWKAVLFDLDGTLIDAFSPIVYALNKTLLKLGREPMSKEAIYRHTGRGECSMVSLFGEQRELALQHFLTFHDERLYDISAMQGAENLLQALHQAAIPIAIVTSKSQIRAEQQLEFLGWHHYFSAIIGMTPERKQKPDPHTVCLACDALTVDSTQALMIGDGTADMKAAKHANATAIGICHSFSPQELDDAGADYHFATIGDVHAWLKRQGWTV